MKLLPYSLFLLISFAVFGQSTSNQTFAIVGARIIDGKGGAAIENGNLIFRGDAIVAVGSSSQVSVPKGATIIDGKDKTVIPGLISAHSHLGLIEGGKNSATAYTRDNVMGALRQYERYGITSVMSLGVNRDLIFDIREEQRDGKLDGATLFTAGRGIGAPNGAPPLPAAPDQIDRPATPDAARKAVHEAAGHHVDLVKVWVDDMYGKYPKMDPAIYGAVIDEAHKQHLRVAAHVFYLDDARALLADGLDVIAHSIRDQEVDDATIAKMKAHPVIYIPTFTVDESSFAFAEHPEWMQDKFLADALTPEERENFGSETYREKVKADPATPKVKAAMQTGFKNLKRVNDAGVEIAMGTDSGAMPARVAGWAEHHELDLMVRAGLTTMQALVDATAHSAEVCGVHDRGELVKGKRADFLLLNANPLADIRNTRSLAGVWHNGKQVQGAELQTAP
jgi:imidazolonepropionase-like amidohydrolase